MQSLGLMVKTSLLFCDTISMLISISQNPRNFKTPYRTWLSGINANIYQLALIMSQQKQDIPLFIDQKVWTKFADYIMKFDLKNDKPEKWYELQQRLLEPNWLLTHPRQWINLIRQESAIRIQI